MRLQFPNDFFWGTSTAAAQIETASDHSFKGLRSSDGHIFDRTADHELRRDEDVGHICRFGTVYRCGVDWARLQTEPFGPFHQPVVDEYRKFFKQLQDRDMSIMFVLHHFANPNWFEAKGGWLYEENIGYFTDFVKKCIHHFGRYVAIWNTFNEPNVYAGNAYLMGNFPPHKRSFFKTMDVMKNMSIAHNTTYTMLKVADRTKLVGISQNTALFEGTNPLGWIVAKLLDNVFNKRPARLFEQVDFMGVSYYAHMLCSPNLISEVNSPGKLAKMGYPHDKMWAYKPAGLGNVLRRFHKKYGKPIIITENGVCSSDDAVRIQAIKDYMKVIHECIKEGIYVKGYVHWSTFDNFEWDLGPTYNFGLMRIDPDTKDRIDTEAARFYEQVAKDNAIDV
jgi:beta-glucosidase